MSNTGEEGFKPTEGAEEWLRSVQPALEKLNETERRLFDALFVNEIPYHVIASLFSISDALARKRVQQLRAKLSQF